MSTKILLNYNSILKKKIVDKLIKGVSSKILASFFFMRFYALKQITKITAKFFPYYNSILTIFFAVKLKTNLLNKNLEIMWFE